MENTTIPLHCDSLILRNPSFDDCMWGNHCFQPNHTAFNSKCQMHFYTCLRCFSIWFTVLVYIASVWPPLSSSIAMRMALPTAWPRLTSGLVQIRYHPKKRKKNYQLFKWMNTHWVISTYPKSFQSIWEAGYCISWELRLTAHVPS